MPTVATTPLMIQRHFTSPDTHVYDTVEWQRRDAIIEGENGKRVFEQCDVEFPASWSQMATDIVASKYFRGTLGTPERERSVKQMIDRVVDTITLWGVEDGYFVTSEDTDAFEAELKYWLLHQYASFNSPVWFNIGVPDTPQVASACYILSIADDMASIMEWIRQEAVIFKGGSGAGCDLSSLRGSGEPLRGGGTASGPLSFMKAADASAGVIKSGGKCLPSWQRVYTETGPVAVSELAQRESGFFVVSYDPPARRFKAKRAWAWSSGQKPVYRVKTDKGVFDLSYDHPVRLSTGEAVRASELRPGMSLHKCSIDLAQGYTRVHLQNGKKGKRNLHQMIFEDVFNTDLRGKVLHHMDENKQNNHPSNIEVTTQSAHALHHSMKLVQNGEHVFQLHTFPKNGTDNPMHKDSAFWLDDAGVGAYKEKQSVVLRNSGRASGMQKNAAKQRMINMAWRVLNGGGNIDSFDAYCQCRKSLIGRVPSKKSVMRAIVRHFGSFEAFVREVSEANHRVESVERLGVCDVYSVEVECDTTDDKTAMSGHNFVLWADDKHAGSGIVVFNTRRAAKMIVFNIDHPDIQEFIWCKAHEEDKARTLIAAGYSAGIDGEAYATVSYQNANNSVRVPDEFMRRATGQAAQETWATHWRTNREHVADTFRAADLLRQIAEATHACGDPGIQFDDTINAWHTVPNSGRINATNPCSEFCFLDNTACNLSSINLLKFLRADNSFDTDAYRHAVRIMLTAQEILVSRASYPTEAIAKNSEDFRPLGLGYANLGALLMASGLPYDSERGRAYAAAVTALMTGEAYAQSARLAAIKGPFNGYAVNREPMLAVMEKHASYVKHIGSQCFAVDATDASYNTLPFSITQVIGAAAESWSDALELGTQYGYRNAQATLAAPTGTISFMMDCDTTGVEPDTALVKYKKLVGGGTLKQVNGTVKRALETLGYDGTLLKSIVDDIESSIPPEKVSIGTADLSVFDCAFTPQDGTRSISPEAHIRMVAAVQPFLSGSVSKTVNCPQETTVEDIEYLYILAWQLGLKSVAIYRDGCKATQPVTTQRETPAQVPQNGTLSNAQVRACLDNVAVYFPHIVDEFLESYVAQSGKQYLDEANALLKLRGAMRQEKDKPVDATPQPHRKRLPDERPAITHKFSINSHEGYFIVGMYPDTQQPGELFIVMAKEGSTISGLMDAFGIAVSLALQYGVPLKALTDKFRGMRFEPAGFTSNAAVPMAQSLMDYIFRWLASKFQTDTPDMAFTASMPAQDVLSDSISQVTQRQTPALDSSGAVRRTIQASSNGMGTHAPICSECGQLMTVRTGSCFVCHNCGTSAGCS